MHPQPVIRISPHLCSHACSAPCPPQGFAGQAYAQPAFLQQAYSPPQPPPFLQHSMPNMPQGMQLTPMGPQSSMNTMFAGQPGQFQQWQ